jgi:hypothetical protein
VKFTQHLKKLCAPLVGTAFGLAAFVLPSPSAHAVAVQGCVKLNGVLTPGVRVDVFDANTCTRITTGYTFGAGGDFVIRDATGFANNRSIYLMLTTPDGCIEIVDNATVCNAVITDPTDPAPPSAPTSSATRSAAPRASPASCCNTSAPRPRPSPRGASRLRR